MTAKLDYKGLLPQLEAPHDIAGMSQHELLFLAEELRQRIINSVSRVGGHLASSLGVVELTMAILRVFNPKYDKIIWDVGHQSYAYKLLTGRWEQFDTLRQCGGLSGYPRLAESPYDHFGVGHSSTSISAALGMVMAREQLGGNNHVLAVIGDGALTGGMAYEALNHAGELGKPLIVILNDNQMSISRNVGALSYFFSRKLSARWVRRVKREVSDFLLSVPGVGEDMLMLAQRSKKSFKTFFTPGILFEALRFSYIGPVNGHNLEELEQALRIAASVDKPVLVHVLTQKGKGYAPAENNPVSFHGIGRFNPGTGDIEPPREAKDCLSFTQVFSEALLQEASIDNRVVAITAAMPEGTGLVHFAKRFPNRFYDVGICEQHAVTFAAGLATQGLKPVIAVYSTFLQRGYDQVIHDVCLQNLPVVFALDRAGLVGEDGPTHHGVFDISYLRAVPNLSILAPRGRRSMQNALATALCLGTPVAIRYPRGDCHYFQKQDKASIIPCGKGELLRGGDGELAVIAIGGTVHDAYAAATRLEEEGRANIAVFDPLWIKPLPAADILELAAKNKKILIVEESALAGGFGSAVLEFLSEHNLLGKCRIFRHGLPDSFVEHGPAAQLRAMLGLDSAGLQALMLEVLEAE